MSPVSRGRKTKKQSRHRREQHRDPRADVVRGFRPVLGADDALLPESFASGVEGSMLFAVPTGFWLETVAYAVERATPEAMAFLCAFAETSSLEEVRAAAAAGAGELTRSGLARPAWDGELGRAAPGRCLLHTDLFADDATLYCEFSLGGSTHTVTVDFDYSHLDPFIEAIGLHEEGGEVLAELRRAHADDPVNNQLEQIDPAHARFMIEDGVAYSDALWLDEAPEGYRDLRALALARCRVMPPAAPPPLPSIPDREAILAEFLGAHELPPGAARIAGLFLDFGAEADGGRLLRVSPAKATEFLRDWIGRRAFLDKQEAAALPEVFTAWNSWAARRNGLPDDMVGDLIRSVAVDLPEAVLTSSPEELYTEDLDPDDPGFADGVARRRFALPHTGTGDFPVLHPGHPDDRDLLIAAEHPAEEGGDDDGEASFHLALHAVVAAQLWDDEPPETWAEAQRLLATGLSRHEVLHRLCDTASQQVLEAITGQHDH